MEVAEVPSPIGVFRIVYEGRSVRLLDLLEPGVKPLAFPEEAKVRKRPFPADSPPRQLLEYFQGHRARFDLDLELGSVSPFDQDVYRVLVGVPPGKTITYGALARSSGHAGAARAVGGAMHRNPIPIVIPCHRILARGGLGGYSGGTGLPTKRALLALEGAAPPEQIGRKSRVHSAAFSGPQARAEYAALFRPTSS
ncbi:MAG: methylated-DNA--[protein]-cysteine S-methyltransferase [Thermoplasmata archaeon]